MQVRCNFLKIKTGREKELCQEARMEPGLILSLPTTIRREVVVTNQRISQPK